MAALRNELAALDVLFDPADDGRLPPGYSVYQASEIGVTNSPGDPDGRPHNVVENEHEIALLFAEQDRATVVCGYCGCEYRTRSKAWALKWFRDGHDCVSPFAVANPLAA